MLIRGIRSLILLSVGLAACQKAPDPEPAPESTPPPPKPPEQPKQAPKADPSTLAGRFPVPPGYERVAVEDGSFGAWLRQLPLEPEGSPVKSHAGDVVHPGDDQYVAGVVALDVGEGDLQQSPDVVIRLHAEWLWSRGAKNLSYKSATGLDMPLSRWAKGQRLIANGASVFWAQQGKAQELDRSEFRKYLSAVFTWANSTSLAQQSKVIGADELAAGDFFLHDGSPGHALVILDIAQKGSVRVALFGQALNPAQSIHVLRPGRATPWFSLRPGEPVVTPFTSEFSWQGLRRLDAPSEEEADESSG